MCLEMRHVQVSAFSTILPQLSSRVTRSFGPNSVSYDDASATTTTSTTRHYSSFAAMGGGSNSSDSSDISLVAPPSSVTVSDLRKISVTDADGKSVTLGDLMGSDEASKSPIILVFLRHLGCFHCWSYAREWTLLMEEIRQFNNDDDDQRQQNSILGPIFVSIGDEHRLNAFLDKNPDIPRSQIAVDGYDFAAYKEAGFGRFDEKPESVTKDVVPRPIELGGWKGWWTFLTSFMPLAPVTPDMKFPEMLTPEGLFWVGGTMVIQGDEIVYRWDDRNSGDHPNASKVLEIAKDMALTSL